MDILALLQPIEDSLSKTTLRQMSRIIIAMLAMTGRVTMLGVARWAGKGGSYRTVQRFYNTAIPWSQVFWQFFRQHLFEQGEAYILAGDESVVSKAGEKTYGLDRFFSGLQQKTIPSLSFLQSRWSMSSNDILIHVLYETTGSIYPGAILNALLVAWMFTSSSVIAPLPV